MTTMQYLLFKHVNHERGTICKIGASLHDEVGGCSLGGATRHSERSHRYATFLS